MLVLLFRRGLNAASILKCLTAFDVVAWQCRVLLSDDASREQIIDKSASYNFKMSNTDVTSDREMLCCRDSARYGIFNLSI